MGWVKIIEGPETRCVSGPSAEKKLEGLLLHGAGSATAALDDIAPTGQRETARVAHLIAPIVAAAIDLRALAETLAAHQRAAGEAK